MTNLRKLIFGSALNLGLVGIVGCGVSETPQREYIQCQEIDPDALCFSPPDLVCGSDGKTYSNACEACEVADFYKRGECEVIDSREECEAAYGVWKQWGLNPVESCNLRTSDYGMPCLNSRKCEGNCLTVYCGDFFGDSPNNYIKCQGKVGEEDFCIAIFDPVCGIDWNTYSNSCEACRDVDFYRNGSCSEEEKNELMGYCSEFQTTFGCFSELYDGRCLHVCAD